MNITLEYQLILYKFNNKKTKKYNKYNKKNEA